MHFFVGGGYSYRKWLQGVILATRSLYIRPPKYCFFKALGLVLIVGELHGSVSKLVSFFGILCYKGALLYGGSENRGP